MFRKCSQKRPLSPLVVPPLGGIKTTSPVRSAQSVPTNSLPLLLATRTWQAALLLAVLAAQVSLAQADVAVLSNRTNQPVRVSASPGDEGQGVLTIEAGESRPVFFDVAARLRVQQADQVEEVIVEASQAYYFGRSKTAERLVVQCIGLGGNRKSTPPPEDPSLDFAPNPSVITVKLLVDDEELTHRQVWEPLLRKRLSEASEVFLAHSHVRFRVVAIDVWNSSPELKDFNRTLKEFEREVNPAPAQVAIGFTSQYRIQKGRYHLGGTRGPLHPHILLKERAVNILETERLELLVHELGHYLGASHSPEPNSVMRPLINGGQQRRKGATIKFDPVNALLISIVGEEIRRHRATSVSDFSLPTRRRMDQIYAALEPTLPKDPAAGLYRRIVRSAGSTPLINDVRRILDHLIRVGKLQQRLTSEKNPQAVSGDELLQLYVRQAAFAAKRVRRDTAPQAFLLALGVAFDDQGMLASLPIAGQLMDRLETSQQRDQRIAAIGKPTMYDRADLPKHFFVSAHAVTLVGTRAARGVGIAKELLDSRDGGSGFSFADMAANRAGIVFAAAVLSKRLSLDDVSKTFTVERYLPKIDDLAEGLAAKDFFKSYGGVSDPRFAAELERIEKRIAALSAKPTEPTDASH